jgi:hypothetical protein
MKVAEMFMFVPLRVWEYQTNRFRPIPLTSSPLKGEKLENILPFKERTEAKMG